MTTSNKSAKNWQLNKCTLTQKNGEIHEINAGLQNFQYWESLNNLGPTAVISWSNLKKQMYPKNGAYITIELMTTAHTDDDVWTHHFMIEKKQEKNVEGNKIYTCELICPQSKLISKFSSTETLKGTPKSILEKVVTDETSVGEETPLDVVSDGNEPFNKLAIATGTKVKLTDIIYKLCTQSIPSSGKSMNTAGYFIWGSKKNRIGNKDSYGLQFKSIDSLLAVGGTHNGADAEYEYYQTNSTQMVDMPAQLIISSFKIIAEGDCKKMCDTGVFRANVVLYNVDKKTYHKRTWDLRDYWDRWGHIAKVPGNKPWEDSDIVAEVMDADVVNKTFMLEISHEKFHDEEDPADPGQIGDGENSQSAEYQDWDEETVVQYHARYATMFLSTSKVVVPGNQYLHAGDKVKLYLRASIPDAQVQADSYDKELSGHYLIYELTHTFNHLLGECSTALTLIRDTLNKNC